VMRHVCLRRACFEEVKSFRDRVCAKVIGATGLCNVRVTDTDGIEDKIR
jgi:hypothetical protein